MARGQGIRLFPYPEQIQCAGSIPSSDAEAAAFIQAGTLRDSAIGGDGPELPDHFHSPLDKRGETSDATRVDWRGSHNFAQLWLSTVLAQEHPRAQGIPASSGCGGHIAADWVAHSWLPVFTTSDPLWHKLDYQAWHLMVEAGVDGYVQAVKRPALPSPYRVRVDAPTAKGLVLSHAFADSLLSAEGDLWVHTLRADWARGVLPIQSLDGLLAAWAWKVPIYEQVARTSYNGVLWDQFANQIDAVLDQAISTAYEWETDPTSQGIKISGYVAPLYDPTEPLPGPLPHPVVESVTGTLWQDTTAMELDGEGFIDADAAMSELVEYIGLDALEAGYVRTAVEPAIDGEGVEYVGWVEDEAGLEALITEKVAAVASGAEGADLNPLTCCLAVSLDRVISGKVSTVEAAADMLAPFILPEKPLENEVVCNLRPTVAVRLEDVAPSAGLDRSRLTVLLDGQDLGITLGEGEDAFSYRLAEDLRQGYHTFSVTAYDNVGQGSILEWPFVVALDLTWLPPLASRGRNEWRYKQTVPVKFTLRDDEGKFGVDPGVIVKVYDPADLSGNRVAVFRAGRGSDSIRISTEDEFYLVNVDLSKVSWVAPGMTLTIAVEGGGYPLGETELRVR